MLPVALAAFWTLACQLVLVARWPAMTTRRGLRDGVAFRLAPNRDDVVYFHRALRSSQFFLNRF
jgi:hypothetical protein